MTEVHSIATTDARELSIAISKARVIPGSPARVTFVLQNRCDCDFVVVSSAFEIKRTNIGARHALPKAGWGYVVTDAVTPATLLPARSELWTTFEADTRTTFRGAVSAEAPASLEPQYYFAGRILYRAFAASCSRPACIVGWPTRNSSARSSSRMMPASTRRAASSSPQSEASRRTELRCPLSRAGQIAVLGNSASASATGPSPSPNHGTCSRTNATYESHPDWLPANRSC